MPQGVRPPAQLLIVPLTVTPSELVPVTSSSEPRAGPVNSKSVSKVKRRFSSPSIT